LRGKNELKNLYNYPSLYIKGSHDPPFCISENGYYSISHKEIRGFGYSVIENSLDTVIDRSSSQVKEDYCLEIPWLNKALKVKKGTIVRLLEISASRIFLVKREGDQVRKREIIAHTITDKSESRSIKANSDGVIVFIGSISLSNPEAYLLAVADSDSVEWLRRA
jgi:hypothetical protein